MSINPQISNSTLSKPARSRRTRIASYARILLYAALLATFVHFAYSRILSSWREVQTFVDPNVRVTGALAADRPLRVAAWNIAHGRGSGSDNWDGGTRAEREQRLREMARVLREADLDVVVLNEVDFDSTWSGRVNQAEFIAREAGFPYRIEQRNVDAALPFFSWRFGNAILSRYPLSHEHPVDFPGYSKWEALLAGKKHGLVCRVSQPTGKQVRVLAVHLSHRSERVRTESAQMIEQERSRRGPPLIALGDFNSTPVDYPHAEPDDTGYTSLDRLLADDRFSTLKPVGPSPEQMTFPSSSPSQAIDWILVAEPLRLVSQEVLPLTLSDHRPVVGEIEWSE